MALTQISDAGLKTPASDLQDNEKIVLGTGNDFELVHDGSNSYIQEDGTGQIIIRGWSPRIQTGYSPTSGRNTGEDSIVCITDGAVELYYDAAKKLETTSWGVDCQGNTRTSGDFVCVDSGKFRAGNGSDVSMYHNGSTSFIEDIAGDLRIRSDGLKLQSAGGENYVHCTANGAVLLYHDNTNVLKTISTGVTASVAGEASMNIGSTNAGGAALYFDGDSNGDFIGADYSHIRHTTGGDMEISCDSPGQDSNFYVYHQTSGGQKTGIYSGAGGAVKLYYDGVVKLQTESWGVQFPDDVKFDNPDTAGRDVTWVPSGDKMRWQDNTMAVFGDDEDLYIEHDGNHSYINHNGQGDLFVQTDGLFAVQKYGTTERLLNANADGNVELFYDSSVKFATVTEGCKVTGKLGVGIAPTRQLHLHVADSGSSHALFTNGDTGSTSSDGFLVGLDSAEEGKIWQHEDKGITIGTNNAQRIYIQNGGHICFGKDTTNLATNGQTFLNNGEIWITRDNGIPFSINRKSTDGQLVRFHHDGGNEGNISISGSTVSYNGGHLSRWSQFKDVSPTDKSARPTIYQGTVLSNLDELCQWDDSTVNQQLNMTKVSDVDGDKNVAGVFWAWDDDPDDTVTMVNDFYIAMTGDMVIRVAASTTVARGDLLISAGDGTAKPQADDIIRSSTIAKIISTNSTATYADGSKAYPCVLMAC